MRQLPAPLPPFVQKLFSAQGIHVINNLETTRLLEVGCRDVRQRRKVTQFPRPKGIFPKGFEFVFYHESAVSAATREDT